MKNVNEALDWAVTYLRDVVGYDIENNVEYQQAVKILNNDLDLDPEPQSHHPAPGDEWDYQREMDDNHKHDQSEY
jgi:hypothetical protein